MGADVVVGSTQRFGVPLFYGGPHAGYMSVRRRARAAPAGAAGRRLGRRRGPPGLPARAADPRAAHPPRQGDLQHLHRPGAARRRRLDVRRLPRSRGPARDRGPHPPARGRAGRGPWRRSGSPSSTSTSSTRSRWSSPGAPPRSSRPRTSSGCSCGWSTPTTSGVSTSEATTRSTLVRRARGVRRRRRPRRGRVLGRGGAPERAAPRRRRTSPTRSSPSTAARPRCCATCVGSPRATTRWTAG